MKPQRKITFGHGKNRHGIRTYLNPARSIAPSSSFQQDNPLNLV
jgi:hypothetical protein